MKKIVSSVLILLVTHSVFAADSASSKTQANPKVTVVSGNITLDEIREAQKAWGQALITINADYEKGGHKLARKTAEKVLNELYAYNTGNVLFKPTLSFDPETFRVTRESALAYFVGGDKNYPDSGFAIKGWKHYDNTNVGVYIDGDIAITMGKVYLTNSQGTTTVDKTWGFKRDPTGKVRIFLHHSSLPYVPTDKQTSSEKKK